MAYNSSNSLTIRTGLKSAIAALTLVLMIPGSPVFAKTVTPEKLIPATISAPVKTITIASDAQETDLTVQDVLLSVCQEKGYKEDCARTLLGMLWNESNNVSTAIGDHGKARGYFQIWYKLHNVSIACAEDLVCSARFSLSLLESHSYPKYVAYAVQCHNSCNINNGYAARALKNGKMLWDQPLEIKQAAPIELSFDK